MIRKTPKTRKALSAMLWGMVGAYLWSTIGKPLWDKTPTRWKIIGGVVLAGVLLFAFDQPELAWPVLALTGGVVAGVILEGRRGRRTTTTTGPRPSVSPGAERLGIDLEEVWRERDQKEALARADNARPRASGRARARGWVKSLFVGTPREREKEDLRKAAAAARARGERTHKGGKRRTHARRI